MFKIVFLTNERNDATDYYVNLIKKSIEEQGDICTIINDLKEIEKDDVVLTISLKAFFLTWLKNPRQKIIHWFQGVTPEEAVMIYKNSWKRKIKWLYLSFFENFVLRYSKFNFFVSDAMHKHYNIKYKYMGVNYLIMPCYNQSINVDAFNDNKYKNVSFVYAGSLSDWQCIKESIWVFKEVHSKIPDAKFYLFTSEKEKAKKIIEKEGVVNVIIDYVGYNELNERLKNIKYGFLIREDTLVNNVATPTKMNGYLANGIIPIYINVIDDFKSKISGKIQIRTLNYKDLPKLIIDFEKVEVNVNDVFLEYSSYFNEYYSDNNYSKNIALKLKKIKLL